MKKHSMRRVCAVVMSMVLLITTVFVAMPTATFAQTAESSNILPTAVSVSGNGSASATSSALSVTTKGTTAVTATLTGASFYLDADGFNALSLSVNTEAATALTLNLTNSEGAKSSITTNDLGGETYVDNGKLPAGDHSELVLDIAKMTSWDNTLVTLSSVTVQTDEAATVVFYGMEATLKETTGTSMMTGTRTIGNIAAGTHTTTATDLADGGVDLRVNWQSTTPLNEVGNVCYTYATPMEIHTYANVYDDQLYYSFNVASGKKAKLFFNIYDVTAGTYKEVAFSSLIDSSLANNTAISAAKHYEGTISFRDIAAACGFTAVENGIMKIKYVKMYLEGSLHALSLIRTEVHNTPVSLMPSAATAQSLGLSYDGDGFLTYTATKKGTVTIPVEKYVDVKVLQYMDAVVTADLTGTLSGNNFGWDIGFNGTGIKASDNTAVSKETTLWNDWGQTSGNTWNIPQKNSQTKFEVNQPITGSLTWGTNGISLDTRIYYIESIVLKLGVAGTLKVRDFYFTDTTTFASTQLASPALSLGDIQGERGKTVNVPLMLDSTTGILNFDAAITFDSTYLSIDKSAIVWNTALLNNSDNTENTDVTTSGFHSANIVGGNTLKLAYIGVANTAVSGVIATIPVTIADNSPAGRYCLDMTVGDVAIYSTEFGDPEYHEVLCTDVGVTDGKITVADEQTPVTVTVGSGDVFSGETVAIPVSISEGHFAKSGTVKIAYNAAALSITKNDIAFAAGYAGTVVVADGVIMVTLNNTTTTALAGTMFTLTFTANEEFDDAVTLGVTVSDFTASQGAATYALPVVGVDGAVTVTTIDPALQTITFTASPAADHVGKNDIVRVDIEMDAQSPVTAFDLELGFDAAQVTPVVLDGGYVAWTTAAAGATASTYDAASGKITLSYQGDATTALSSGIIGTVYFTLNTAQADVTIDLTNGAGAEILHIPDAPHADANGMVETTLVNCYGGTFRVGTTTTTTTTTTLPSVAADEVQFMTVTSSDVVATEQTFTVDILLNSPKGVQDFELLLTVDTDILTPIKQNGSWVTWNAQTLGSDDLDGANRSYLANYNATTGVLYIGYVAAQANTAPRGVIGTITFTVNADALAANMPFVQTNMAMTCEAVTWEDPDSAAADEYGDVTPRKITATGKTLTVYHSQKVEYYDSTQTTLLETKYFPVGIETAYNQLEGVNTDKLNYAFLGWQQFDEDISGDTIKMYPAYGYTIEVVGGTLSSKYQAQWMNDANTKAHFSNVRKDFTGYTGLFGYDNHAQVIADEAPAGKVFSHWTDQFGNIVSYNATYTFYVPANLLLIAHYNTTAPAQTPYAALQTLRSETADGKTSMTWVCAVATAKDCTITEIGIVLSPQANYDVLTKPNGSTAVELKATEGRSLESWQYSITVNKVAAGKSRYAVAYVKYTDAAGNSGVAYSANFMGMTAPAQ